MEFEKGERKGKGVLSVSNRTGSRRFLFSFPSWFWSALVLERSYRRF